MENADGNMRGGPDTLDRELVAQLGAIFSLLHRHTGHDFSRYKEGTMLRRIRRRIQSLHAASVADYVAYVEKEPSEAQALLKELLIGVTQFFRDPEAFEVLAREVLPGIVQGRSADVTIRVWVPGCASGEEAYSLAMLLREQLDGAEEQHSLQLFATDLDGDLLAEARRGRYPAEIAERVSPQRLARFFTREGQEYQARNELREMCIFAQHSLIRDPPFTQLDLISCRNVLIYLAADLQRKLIPLFHRALRSGGCLFLGPSEGVAALPDLFETVDQRHRIFRRIETMTPGPVDLTITSRSALRASQTLPAMGTREPAKEALRERAGVAFERAVLDEYASPAAVVNESGDILFLAGRAFRYLQPPAGPPSVNILQAAPTNLRQELRTALRAAARDHGKVVRDDVIVDIDETRHRVRLTVRPLAGLERDAGLYLVVLQEIGVPEKAEDTSPTASPSRESVIEDLESELRNTRAELRNAIERLESANEELKSANEELISTNEELISTNEELISSNEEMQRRTAELDATLSSMANGVVIYGSDGQKRFGNQAAQEILEYTPQEQALSNITERTGAMSFAKEDGNAFAFSETPVARALRGEVAKNVVMVIHRASRDIWVSVNAAPIRGPNGELLGAVSSLIDVTERRRMEARAAWLASFPERNPHPITEVSLAGEIHYANPAARRLFPDLDKHIPLHPWLGDWAAATWILQNNGQTSVERTVTVGVATYAQSLYLVREVGRVRVYGRDITARRQVERQVKDQGDLLETIVNHLPSGAILLRGSDLTILMANPAYQAIAPGKETVGRTLLDVWPEAQTRIADLCRQVLHTGEPYVAIDEAFSVSRTIGGPQETAYFTWALHRVRLPGDQGWGLLNTVWETTENRRMEQELRLANQRLREDDQRKNEFLAMLSHELRNPLAPIRNSLYVLDHAASGSDQAKRAQATIDRQTAHLTRLVDDLLDVARISKGKIQIRKQVVDLSDLVRRTVDDHRSLFATEGVALEVALPDGALWADGDPTRLAQVLGNLLHNAAKFSDRGGHAFVMLAREEKKAVVRVRDAGVGVSRDMLARVFEPFTQAETTLDRTRGGLGLGLALVKGLVELHGGTVSVESEGPGKGAEFTLRLPLLELASSSPSAPSPARATSTRRVLVIEDNVDAADSLREVLEFNGHAVEVAHSGGEGIEKCGVFRPDMILCDIGLPGMDGYEVARRLRADRSLAPAYLVALTGYALPEDLAKAKEAGFDEHIAKPASLERIEQLLVNAPK
jgi:two-component system CheB/CheR fusion protein